MQRRIAVGLFGLGAFGKLAAVALSPYFRVLVCDSGAKARKDARRFNLELVGPMECARADYVILAVPVQSISRVVEEIAPHVRPGATVIDVASVKLRVAETLLERLPPYVDILCSHPLFGPQSAKDQLAGHRIALCRVRGNRMARIEGFLSQTLKLKVIWTTPEAHDRDMAVVQGLTHLIARVLREMGPLPTELTTHSFNLIVHATEQVGRDSDQLFQAIEHENPFSAPVRDRFLAAAEQIGRKTRH